MGDESPSIRLVARRRGALGMMVKVLVSLVLLSISSV